MRAAVAAGLAVFTVIVLIAGITGVSVVDEALHPDRWDPRVADLAEFVEDERGLRFDRPVFVDFLGEEEFRLQVTSEDADLTEEDRAEIEDATAELRALGLVEGDFDLFGESNAISGGSILAYYNPETERITVRGTELSPYLRGTIVHELTHALQDQHFDLEALQEEVGPDGDFRFRSVVEGDAVKVGQAYYDQLSDKDKDAYDDEEQAAQAGGLDGEEVDDARPDYAPVLAAFMGAPYSIGPGFVSVLSAVDGNSGIDEALTDLPRSEAAIFDPTLYFDDVEPLDVDVPEPADGTEALDSGSFGALAWYVVLSARIDEHAALEFVDAWRGDSYLTYRDGDEVCVRARYRAGTDTDLDRGRDALEEWVEAMPVGSAEVTDVDRETVELRSCDPGTEASVTTANDVSRALTLPAVRLVLVAQTLSEGGVELDTAWCFADAIVDGLSLEQLQSDKPTPEIQAAVMDARTTCRN